MKFYALQETDSASFSVFNNLAFLQRKNVTSWKFYIIFHSDAGRKPLYITITSNTTLRTAE